jgi:DNA modification methylase
VDARDRQRPKAGEAPDGADAGVRVLGDVEFVRGHRCEDVLPLLPTASFDACVTDPPYGIGIADWDTDVPGVNVWAAVFRVLKPGAWLIAFGSRRTYQRLATPIETAGFEIVDQGIWVYGTGRPPSKKHLKPAHEPFVIAVKPGEKPYFDVDAARTPWRTTTIASERVG